MSTPSPATIGTSPNDAYAARSPLPKLIAVEAKLFLREPVAVFWGLGFPSVLFFILGAFFPGFRDPLEDADGVRLIDLYMPIILGVALATLAFATLPGILATYRQFGILRRLSITPIHPAKIVLAQLVVQLSVAVMSATLAISVGVLVFDIPLPKNLLWFGVAFILAASSVFAVGLLIGARARTVAAGQGIGMAVYFPMLFFAGVYFPRDGMSGALRTISDLTPSGAGVQALQDAWGGHMPTTSSLLVMTAFTVGAGLLAARLFRWE
jgi:ABC-2 type transport system permease protein